MLNSEVGEIIADGARRCISTRLGSKGYALYGPYDLFRPGAYDACFVIEPVSACSDLRNHRCAVAEVTTNLGRTLLASRKIAWSELKSGRTAFTLPFTLKEPQHLEFRIWVTGKSPLLIQDYVRAIPRLAGEDPRIADERMLFPHEEGKSVPFFVEHEDRLWQYYEQGYFVSIRNGEIVLGVGGVSFFARSPDDFNFIHEVFRENAYNLSFGKPLCVIDVGMNIGLTSLMFAAKSEVREIWSFEPFPDTYRRACANIGLNPGFAGKIRPHNVGLSNRNSDEVITVARSADSGSASTVPVANGVQIHLTLRDAGALLEPVFARAEQAGLGVVVKMDCEGSEFDIFASLAEKGLLGRASAFMVEWHAMFPERTKEELIAPLRAAGFMVFDRSPPVGNGFFYAAKLGGG